MWPSSFFSACDMPLKVLISKILYLTYVHTDGSTIYEIWIQPLACDFHLTIIRVDCVTPIRLTTDKSVLRIANMKLFSFQNCMLNPVKPRPLTYWKQFSLCLSNAFGPNSGFSVCSTIMWFTGSALSSCSLKVKRAPYVVTPYRQLQHLCTFGDKNDNLPTDNGFNLTNLPFN